PDVAQNVFQVGDVGGEFLSAAPPLPSRPPGLAERTGHLHRFVDEVVLSHLGPVGMVVDETLKITEYSGDMLDYLVTRTEFLGAYVMESLRPELRAPISAAIEQARRTQVAVVAENVPSGAAGRSGTIAVTVVPISLSGMPLHFLILLGRSSEVVDGF